MAIKILCKLEPLQKQNNQKRRVFGRIIFFFIMVQTPRSIKKCNTPACWAWSESRSYLFFFIKPRAWKLWMCRLVYTTEKRTEGFSAKCKHGVAVLGCLGSKGNLSFFKEVNPLTLCGICTFHKGLLVGSDSRKNLSMVLLVSRDMCQFFFWTLYGFSWSSGVTWHH